MIKATRPLEAPRETTPQPALSFAARAHNKAHTATANRVAKRLEAAYNEGPGYDISLDGLTVEVETTATLPDALRRLETQPGRVFVAMTNKEGVIEALHQTVGSRVGVMDPHGNVIRECR